MFGDMDHVGLSEVTKSQLPARMSAEWPTKNGVWIVVAYVGVATQPPIYLGPNPLPNDDVNAVIGQLVNSQLVSGVPLPLVNKEKITLIFMACNYKTNSTWIQCKLANTEAGQIVLPPPEELEETTSCSIFGSIDLRHDNLTPETVVNNSADAMAFVTCNTNAKVSLSIEGMVPLKGVTGLFSQLTVGDARVGEPYSFMANTAYTPVMFKSVLKAIGTVTPGDFSGTAKVELTFP